MGRSARPHRGERASAYPADLRRLAPSSRMHGHRPQRHVLPGSTALCYIGLRQPVRLLGGLPGRRRSCYGAARKPVMAHHVPAASLLSDMLPGAGPTATKPPTIVPPEMHPRSGATIGIVVERRTAFSATGWWSLMKRGTQLVVVDPAPHLDALRQAPSTGCRLRPGHRRRPGHGHRSTSSYAEDLVRPRVRRPLDCYGYDRRASKRVPHHAAGAAPPRSAGWTKSLTSTRRRARFARTGPVPCTAAVGPEAGPAGQRHRPRAGHVLHLTGSWP